MGYAPMHLDAFPVNFRQAMYTTRFPRMHIWTNAEPYTGLGGERVNTIHTGEHYRNLRAVVTGNEAKLMQGKLQVDQTQTGGGSATED